MYAPHKSPLRPPRKIVRFLTRPVTHFFVAENRRMSYNDRVCITRPSGRREVRTVEEKHAVKKDPRRRHRLSWKLARPLARLFVWLRLGYRTKLSRIRGPFLLVCNHVTDWDPVLVGTGMLQQFYYVASEHLLRSGLGGKLVNWLQAPIPRQKGGNAAGTVMAILRHLKAGDSVGLFPEGNRCWDGVTGDLLPSVGKLARTAGVKLVTYRLEGGYFVSPRWGGSSIRRGRMRGGVVNVYTPEALRAMTPAEITAHIEEDLHEDAYARQRRDPARYRSRRGAEHMETLLFLCPKCGMLHSLRSRKNTVTCWKCGFTFRWLPTGFLAGDGLPADNLRDWNRWQEERIADMCANVQPDKPVFTDGDVSCGRVDFSKGVEDLGGGEMRLFADRLELPGVTVPLDKLSGIALRGPQDLYVSDSENTYLVRSRVVKCMVKYISACRIFTGKKDLGL